MTPNLVKNLRVKIRNKEKIFVVGRNKTGTTSLHILFRQLGFIVGNQREAELLLRDWADGDFSRLIKYCGSAEVFQDVPFSFKDTYKILDERFPNAKFILTVRDDSDVWYDSLCRFHTKIVGKERLPTWEDLENFSYCYKGWLLEAQITNYGVNSSNLYSRELYKKKYEEHNFEVIDYFSSKPEKLLLLNIAEDDSSHKLGAFLGISESKINIPHENRTQ